MNECMTCVGSPNSEPVPSAALTCQELHDGRSHAILLRLEVPVRLVVFKSAAVTPIAVASWLSLREPYLEDICNEVPPSAKGIPHAWACTYAEHITVGNAGHG